MVKNMNLQKLCNEIHIPTIGIAPWPLPEEARHILFEEKPCPFTESIIENRLQPESDFTPRSAIVCLFPYYVPHNGPSNLSRYTWSTDYHIVVNKYLQKLVDHLRLLNENESFSIHCDTSPLADRYMAYLAGLGFYGKNKCFINPIWGSYVFIGTILTTMYLEPNEPSQETCLSCNRCIETCLGNCLGESNFTYDTCKSYITQKKGDLTDEEQSIIRKSPLLFGCDQCQDVCPHNQNIPTTPIKEFQHIEPLLDINKVEHMTNKQFKEAYGHRAFSWRGKSILMRNQKYML